MRSRPRTSSADRAPRGRPSPQRGAQFAAVPILLVSFMAGLADRFLYFPTSELDGGTPAALGLAYEDVSLDAGDGVKLHGWIVPAREEPDGTAGAERAGVPAERARRNAPVVLFLHGNAGNVSHRLDKLALLHGQGASVLLIDYRGYGKSSGEPDEAGLYRDAEVAYDELVRRGFRGDRIVVYGESLGGAVATDLATRHEVAGLILESAPTSILEVARYHYPLLPIGAFLAARYDALSRIERVSAPILVLHSTEDEIVPFAMAERMMAGARPPKSLTRLRGGHNDGFLVSGQVYQQALREFLEQLFEGKNHGS
jgi:fermentation-respiration switch protein FrsA (DUF1100 family)